MLDSGAVTATVEQVPAWARAAEARASRPPPGVPENVGMKDGTEPTPMERIHKSRLEAGGGGGGVLNGVNIGGHGRADPAASTHRENHSQMRRIWARGSRLQDRGRRQSAHPRCALAIVRRGGASRLLPGLAP